MKRVALYDQQHKVAKVEAARHGLSLSLLVQLILESGLEKLQKGNAGFKLQKGQDYGAALKFSEGEEDGKS